jgi:hypothetical protein
MKAEKDEIEKQITGLAVLNDVVIISMGCCLIT